MMSGRMSKFENNKKISCPCHGSETKLHLDVRKYMDYLRRHFRSQAAQYTRNTDSSIYFDGRVHRRRTGNRGKLHLNVAKYMDGLKLKYLEKQEEMRRKSNPDESGAQKKDDDAGGDAVDNQIKPEPFTDFKIPEVPPRRRFYHRMPNELLFLKMEETEEKIVVEVLPADYPYVSK